ncbi:ATP-dependent DNA helicase PIF1-like protein [Tanacetum coccineum]
MDNRLIREAIDFDIKTRGTRKTFLYKTIISRLRSKRQIVLAMASSGITSLLLPGGRTAHSMFVIQLELVENRTCGIKQNTHLAELLQQVQLIIWDEALMTQKYAFEALNRTLRDILGYKNPEKRNTIFWGVTVLLGGDFRQILPVIPKGKRAEIVQACINYSELWKSYKLNKWVLDVEDEIVEAKKEDEDEPTCIEIPEDFIINAAESPIEQIVNETFPNFTTKKSDGTYLKERAILTPRNNDADAINAYMFSKFPGPTITYNNADEVCKASTDVLEKQHLYPTEFLNTLNFPGMPTHALNLKKELPIMLLRNVNLSQGESFWEEGDDFRVDVLRFHTCLTDILGFLEKLEWWFEQDIDDEREEDEEDGGGGEV